ncbi:trypsin-like peptidase domain-containing protein [Micromonospora endolithica]|nr:trypsin-like peptidase domain-containing protein [Micromonospora endolithica]TWJ23721.1 trypsin-like peptidase [Micromonospora endolithica]
MQPEGPYRFTHLLGTCPVGKAWAAIDPQGRFLTVAVLEAPAAGDVRWRDAFQAAANALADAPDGQPYVYADFAADSPWVAYSAERGPGAERFLRSLGVDYQRVPTDLKSSTPVSGAAAPVSGSPAPVSGSPAPVSGSPAPVSGLPHVPWGMAAGSAPEQRTSPASDGPAFDSRSNDGQTAGPSSTTPYDSFSSPARRIKPSARPKRHRRQWIAVALVLLLVVTGGAVGLAYWSRDDAGSGAAGPPTAFPAGEPVDPGMRPWEAFPPYSVQARSLAVAAPSLVFLEVVVTGYLRDGTTGTPLRSGAVTFKRRCSGFLVSPDGHVVTSGGCVSPTEESARQVALESVAQSLVREKKLPANQAESYVRSNLPKTRFTGADPATEPTTQVTGQLHDARTDAGEGQLIPGQVVRSQPVGAGNAALVKLARDNLPSVELDGSAALQPASPVLIVGYDTGDTDTRTATYAARARLVTVADTASRGTSPIHRLNSDIGRASYGGLVLDPSGRAVGMLDYDESRPDRAIRVVLPASVLLGLLSEAGVGNRLGDTDRLYRDGLDAYFAGDEAAAIEQLDRVAAAAPANLLARAYQQNALERQQLEGTSPSASTGLSPLLLGLVGALVVALILVVVALRRRRIGG